jgi:ankyrin repeat protein
MSVPWHYRDLMRRSGNVNGASLQHAVAALQNSATPLRIASQNGHVEAMAVLLKAGADVHFGDVGVG